MLLWFSPQYHISADGNKIEKVPKQKLLGIVIDDQLSLYVNAMLVYKWDSEERRPPYVNLYPICI